MTIVPEIASLDAEMRRWRHHLHAHPETAFEEVATAAYVAERLRSFGLEVHTGLAKTGVVGVLSNGSSGEAIGMRVEAVAPAAHLGVERGDFGDDVHGACSAMDRRPSYRIR